MALPIFYPASYEPGAREVRLDEDNSRHIVQVLRMGVGAPLHLTDGRGTLLTATVTEANKKKCLAAISSAVVFPPPERRVSIAISPLKNASRFEWFLEKATEIGVSEIIPLMTERTERQHLRPDRLQNILVSAMLQSEQTWLPVLRPPTPFARLLDNPIDGTVDGPGPGSGSLTGGYERRLIAWLGDQPATVYPGPDVRATLILIGPEGDFTAQEAASAIDHQFMAVTLGKNRLRTETAGVVAATLLCIG
jgi:16S rRNA (uracil1498-N3)-methyltransferase